MFLILMAKELIVNSIKRKDLAEKVSTEEQNRNKSWTENSNSKIALGAVILTKAILIAGNVYINNLESR